MNIDPISLSTGLGPALTHQKSFPCWNDKGEGKTNTAD